MLSRPMHRRCLLKRHDGKCPFCSSGFALRHPSLLRVSVAVVTGLRPEFELPEQIEPDVTGFVQRSYPNRAVCSPDILAGGIRFASAQSLRLTGGCGGVACEADGQVDPSTSAVAGRIAATVDVSFVSG
jgi:hypothetical protein